MSIRRNRVGVCDVVLVAGAGTGLWRDPDTVDGTAPVQIQLDKVPTFRWTQRIVADGTATDNGEITLSAVTASGFTLASAQSGDTGTIRVFGICDQEDL